MDATEHGHRYDRSTFDRSVARRWNRYAVLEILVRPGSVELGDPLQEDRSKVRLGNQPSCHPELASEPLLVNAAVYREAVALRS